MNNSVTNFIRHFLPPKLFYKNKKVMGYFQHPAGQAAWTQFVNWVFRDWGNVGVEIDTLGVAIKNLNVWIPVTLTSDFLKIL